MTYGLTKAGFRPKRFPEIREELVRYYQSQYGPEVDVDPETSILGQHINAHAERESTIWDLLQSVFNARFPSKAEGVALDAACELVGVERLGPRKSTVSAILFGVPGTVVGSGNIASVQSLGNRFVLVDPVTIGLGGNITGVFESQEFGPVQAPSGTLTVIETTVPGWTSITNPLDAELGALTEEDSDLKIRRDESVSIIGAATLDAIRARIINEVAGVIDAIVYENDTNVVDGFGRPPKSIQVVVLGGDSQELADKIYLLKAGGIQPYGTDETETVYDSQGVGHSVSFDRVELRYVWMHIKIRVGNFFVQGVKRKENVSVVSNNPGETLTLILNGRSFSVTTGASATITANSLVSAVNDHASNGWVPITAVFVSGGDLYLESDFVGNDFSVDYATSGTTELTFDTDTPSAGQPGDIRNSVVNFAEIGETNPEQGIGGEVFPSRYATPVNAINDIQAIEIYMANGVGSYWPTTPPTNVLDWSYNTEVVVGPTELAEFDTYRVTVEIIP